MVLFQEGEFSHAQEKPLRLSGEYSRVMVRFLQESEIICFLFFKLISIHNSTKISKVGCIIFGL